MSSAFGHKTRKTCLWKSATLYSIHVFLFLCLFFLCIFICFSVIKYQVLVTTGNYWGAGLDGKVYITLIGERGDSGPRLLYKSNRANPFEKGRVSKFKCYTNLRKFKKKMMIKISNLRFKAIIS